MKKILLTALLLLAASAAHAENGKNEIFDRVMKANTLRCGFIPWPPGFEVDPTTREVKGPTRELFESIIKLAGWKVEFVEVALGSDMLDLNNGRIDAMCAAGPWTITNIKHVDYTTPVTYSPVLVYVRSGDARFKDYSDLDKKDVTFVGIDGDISVDLAALRFPQALVRSLINLTDPALMMREVADGKADAVIIDPVTGDAFMKNNPGLMQPLPVSAPLAVYPLSFSVRWGEERLRQVLSRATEMAINIGLADRKLDLYDPDRKTIYSPAPYYKEPR